MKKICSVFILSLFTALAQAATLENELSWEAPTSRVNGDALDSSEISHFEIKVEGAVQDTFRVEGSEGTEGSYTYTYTSEIPVQQEPVRLEFSIRTFDTYGLSSTWSDTAVFEGVIAPSSAPSQIDTLMHVQNCTNCTLIIEGSTLTTTTSPTGE